MKKQTVAKLEAIENKCLNNGNDFFKRAASKASLKGLKYGTVEYLGTVRQLVDRQEAGIIALG